MRSFALVSVLFASAVFAAPPVRISDSGRFDLPPLDRTIWRAAGNGAIVATRNFALGAPVGGTAVIWYSASGEETARIEVPGEVDDLAATPSGDRVAISGGNRLRVFTRGGRLVGERVVPGGAWGLFLRGSVVYLRRFVVDETGSRFVGQRLDLARGTGETVGDGWVDISEDGRAELYWEGENLYERGADGARRRVAVDGYWMFRYLPGGRRLVGLVGPWDARKLVYPASPENLGPERPLPSNARELIGVAPNGGVYVASDTFGADEIWLVPFVGAPTLVSVPPPGVRRRTSETGAATLGDGGRTLVHDDGAFYVRDVARGISFPWLRAATTTGEVSRAAVSEDGRTAVAATRSDLYGPVPEDAANLLISRNGAAPRILTAVPGWRRFGISPGGRWFDGGENGVDLTTGQAVRLYTDRAKASFEADDPVSWTRTSRGSCTDPGGTIASSCASRSATRCASSRATRRTSIGARSSGARARGWATARRRAATYPGRRSR